LNELASEAAKPTVPVTLEMPLDGVMVAVAVTVAPALAGFGLRVRVKPVGWAALAVQVTETLVMLAEATAPEPLVTLQVSPVGCVPTATA
jgi:hypothetical protein